MLLTGIRQRQGAVLEQFRLRVVLAYLRFGDRRRRADIRTVAGRAFLCLPEVFPPDSFTTSLVIRNLHQVGRRRVLELGCGCGAFAVLAAETALSVVAADISPEAVRNTELNAVWHGQAGLKVLQSDLFAGVVGTYDLIVFNAPFFPGRATTTSESMWFSEDGRIISRFLKEAPVHLAPGGEVWLTHSSIANEVGFLAAIRSAGWVCELIDSRDILIETFNLYRLTRATDGGS